MPCYLFTYHAYGSWLPDHPCGYVKRGHGVQAPDRRMASRYAENQKARSAVFDLHVQRILIDSVRNACLHQACRCHYIATEATHLHVLVSWPFERAWEIVRKQLRGNCTRQLNQAIQKRDWFAKSPAASK